ncbi:hypothetical protein [Bartonella pachyuromydis]
MRFGWQGVMVEYWEWSVGGKAWGRDVGAVKERWRRGGGGEDCGFVEK